jgi:putative RNA 2'-phosphotransferase
VSATGPGPAHPADRSTPVDPPAVSTPRLSRRLSWLLRHGAGESGLAMDEAGWASVDDVLAVAGIARHQLLRAVERNDTQRLQLDGERIRACQGHSRDGMPVTQAGLERSWDVVDPTRPLWHGTSLDVLDAIARHGLRPGRRTHVHLAASADSPVGKRARVDVLLAVDPARLRAAGITVYRASNGVHLARTVPAGCITDAHPHRAAPAVVARTCRAAGLPSPTADALAG